MQVMQTTQAMSQTAQRMQRTQAMQAIQATLQIRIHPRILTAILQTQQTATNLSRID